MAGRSCGEDVETGISYCVIGGGGEGIVNMAKYLCKFDKTSLVYSTNEKRKIPRKSKSKLFLSV